MRQQVEGHEGRGCRLGQLSDPALSRVDSLGERVEVETVGAGDHHLAIENAPFRKFPMEGFDQLGEVSGERLLVAAAQLDPVTFPEHDAAEAVPFRLVEQSGVPG